MKKQLDLRERVYKFYQSNQDKGKMYIISHLEVEGHHERTIRRIIDRFNIGIRSQRKKGSAKKCRNHELNHLVIIFII